MGQIFHFHAPSSPGRPESAVEQAKPVSPSPTPQKTRFLLYGIALGMLLLIVLIEFARAGSPEYVAGVSYFNAGLAGQPITWPGGTINYYTDQGDLSPLLHGPNADAFVADAFTRWTGISTAAVGQRARGSSPRTLAARTSF